MFRRHGFGDIEVLQKPEKDGTLVMCPGCMDSEQYWLGVPPSTDSEGEFLLWGQPETVRRDRPEPIFKDMRIRLLPCPVVKDLGGDSLFQGHGRPGNAAESQADRVVP